MRTFMGKLRMMSLTVAVVTASLGDLLEQQRRHQVKPMSGKMW